MKIYEKLSEPGFHTTVITTFCVDFEAYETIVLPRLRGGGSHNNILLVDHRMLTSALEGGFALPKYAGSLYNVIGLAGKGIFHPKIILQLGRDKARVIISSANMTTAGIAGNLEIGGIVEFEDINQDAQRLLITQVCNYVDTLIKKNIYASEQMKWAKERSRWLMKYEQSFKEVTLVDGSTTSFLINSRYQSISDRFIELINGQPIKRLLVMSPYWDSELLALKSLAARLSAVELIILIDKDKGLFPCEALKTFRKVKIFNIGEFKNSKNRFSHAKLIIAQSESFDHVLFGSANCSVAALGEGHSAINEEANLYRRLPTDLGLQTLELEKFLITSLEISVDALPPFNPPESSALDLKQNLFSPGHFELYTNKLYWWPPENLAINGVQLELLGVDGQILSAEIFPLPLGSKGELRFNISIIEEDACYVRLRTSKGELSAIAIITQIDSICGEIRESRDKSIRGVDAKILALSNITEENLYLLDLLTEIEKMENSIHIKTNTTLLHISADMNKANNDRDEESFRTLPYEQFIARSPNILPEYSISKLGIGGSETYLVRDVLNRLISMLNPSDISNEQVERDVNLDFTTVDLSDEYSELDEDVGELVSSTYGNDLILSAENEYEAFSHASLRDTAEQIYLAVENFNIYIGHKVKNESLTMIDILKLRTILMVIAASGWTEVNSESASEGLKQIKSLHVLPFEGDLSWPRLMGKLLYTFFGNQKSAIHSLNIESYHDDLPLDLAECLATCIWAANLCQLVVGSNKKTKSHNLKKFEQRTNDVYIQSRLSPQKLREDSIVDLIRALNKRFCSKLGFNSDVLINEHLKRCS